MFTALQHNSLASIHDSKVTHGLFQGFIILTKITTNSEQCVHVVAIIWCFNLLLFHFEEL